MALLWKVEIDNEERALMEQVQKWPVETFSHSRNPLALEKDKCLPPTLCSVSRGGTQGCEGTNEVCRVFPTKSSCLGKCFATNLAVLASPDLLEYQEHSVG